MFAIIKYMLTKKQKLVIFCFASIYFAVGTNIGLIRFGYIYKAVN